MSTFAIDEFDPDEPNHLGVISPNFSRAAMFELKNQGGRDYAVFNVPVCNFDKTPTILVSDCRPETVAAYRKAEEITHKYAILRGKEKKAMDEERTKALKALTATLNSGFADCFMQRKDRDGGKRLGLSILLRPIKEDAITKDAPTAALIHTEGRAVARLPYDRNFAKYTVRYDKNYQGKWQTHDCHFIIGTKKEPVELYQSTVQEALRFLIDSEGVHIWNAQFAPVDTETPKPKVVKETTRVTCTACNGQPEVSTAENDAGTAVCPLCKELVSSTLLAEAGGDITSAELEALEPIGINTAEKLARADPDLLKTSAGIKLARAKALVKDAKASIK